jgi:hypothetical protein
MFMKSEILMESIIKITVFWMTPFIYLLSTVTNAVYIACNNRIISVSISCFFYFTTLSVSILHGVELQND